MVFARDARRRHEEASLPLWTTRGLFFRHVVFRLRRRLECIYQVQVILRDEIEWNGRHPCGRWTATCWLTCDSFHPRRVVFPSRFLKSFLTALHIYFTTVWHSGKRTPEETRTWSGNRKSINQQSEEQSCRFPFPDNSKYAQQSQHWSIPRPNLLDKKEGTREPLINVLFFFFYFSSLSLLTTCIPL